MTPLAAANAYTALAGAAGQQQGVAKTAASGVEFGELLDSAVSQFVDAGHAAESAGLQAASGKADTIDVVTAVAETELALETMVSVRDKVIQAYEEIMRMPI